MTRGTVLHSAVRIARERGLSALPKAIGEHVRSEALERKETRVKPALRYTTNRIKYGSAAPKRYRLVHIDPTEVDRLLMPHFWYRASNFGSHIRNGDWDRRNSDKRVMLNGRYEGIDEPTLIELENYGLYTAAKEHFTHGTKWADTDFYRWVTDEWLPSDPDTDQNWYGSRERVQSALRRFDDIYHHIERHGYMTQRELSERDEAPTETPDLVPEHHEVAVNIGRDGELIFDDGRHRFIAARILGLETIPVRVLVRHREWQRLRTIANDASSRTDLAKRVEKHFRHPDMQDVRPYNAC